MRDDQQINIVLCSLFPHNFGSSYEYIIHCQNEDSLSYWMILPAIMLTIEPRMANKIWACSLMYFREMSFWCLFFRSAANHTPLKYRCLINICNRIRPAHLNKDLIQTIFCYVTSLITVFNLETQVQNNSDTATHSQIFNLSYCFRYTNVRHSV